MTDTNKLNDVIRSEGRSKVWLAEKLGIAYNTFLSKCSNKRDFTFGEIAKLCELLNIKSLEEREEIFFNLEVDKMSTEEYEQSRH